MNTDHQCPGCGASFRLHDKYCRICGVVLHSTADLQATIRRMHDEETRLRNLLTRAHAERDALQELLAAERKTASQVQENFHRLASATVQGSWTAETTGTGFPAVVTVAVSLPGDHYGEEGNEADLLADHLGQIVSDLAQQCSKEAGDDFSVSFKLYPASDYK